MPVIEQKTTNKNKVDFDLNRLDKSKTTIFSKYPILPMLVTLMGACASRLIWLSTVFRLPAYHRIEMVYIVYPLSWALTATTHLICYFFVSRKVDRELRAHEAELAARMEESPEEADS